MARHPRGHGCPNLRCPQPPEIHAVQGRAPGRDIPVRRPADALRPQSEAETACLRQWKGNVGGPRVHKEYHRLAVDTTARHVMPCPVSLEHDLGLTPGVECRDQVPVGILLVAQQPLKEKKEQEQPDDPGGEQHGPADARAEVRLRLRPDAHPITAVSAGAVKPPGRPERYASGGHLHRG
jgi:hypothetical protein